MNPRCTWPPCLVLMSLSSALAGAGGREKGRRRVSESRTGEDVWCAALAEWGVQLMAFLLPNFHGHQWQLGCCGPQWQTPFCAWPPADGPWSSSACVQRAQGFILLRSQAPDTRRFSFLPGTAANCHFCKCCFWDTSILEFGLRGHNHSRVLPTLLLEARAHERKRQGVLVPGVVPV